MLRFAILFLLFGGLLHPPARAAETPQNQAPALRWYTDAALAEQARKAKRQPSMIYLFSHRALPCKRLQEEVFPAPEVKERLGQFVLVAINVTQNPKAMETYQLIRVPTMILVDAEGAEIDRAIGYKDAASMVQYLDRTLSVVKGDLARAAIGGFATGAADISVQAPNTSPVTLTYRDPSARTVTVRGDFNDWREQATPMQRDASGTWTATVFLPSGVYEYMFFVNGADYRPDERNPLRRVNPYDGFNSVVVVGNPKISPMISGRSAYFIIYDTEATKIEVAGSFNQWTPQPLFRNPSDAGMWGARFDLLPGEYQYKYLIDGQWTMDPENLNPKKDREGHTNSTFVIR